MKLVIQVFGFLLLEDLCGSHSIPPEIHVWSPEELQSILSCYAAMHGRAQAFFAQSGIPKWLHADPRRNYDVDRTIAHLMELGKNDWTKEQVSPVLESLKLKALLEEVPRALEHIPPTLLYNDFYPPNVAIPKVGGPAVLLDWQLLGSGPLHLDLVNIGFMRGGEAFAHVDSDVLLDFYLHELSAVTGQSHLRQAFLQDYLYANVLAWVDFLPRFVRAMRKSNSSGGTWGKWMDEMFAVCTAELHRAL